MRVILTIEKGALNVYGFLFIFRFFVKQKFDHAVKCSPNNVVTPATTAKDEEGLQIIYYIVGSKHLIKVLIIELLIS